MLLQSKVNVWTPQNSDAAWQSCLVYTGRYNILSPDWRHLHWCWLFLFPCLFSPSPISLNDDLPGAKLTTLSTSPPSSSHLAASSSPLRPWRKPPRPQTPDQPCRLSWNDGFASESPQCQSSNPSWSRARHAPCPECDPPLPGSSPWCAGFQNTSSESTSGAISCPAWSLVSSWCRRPLPTACWQEWSPSMVYTPRFTPTSSTSSWGRPDMSAWGSSASWASWSDR